MRICISEEGFQKVTSYHAFVKGGGVSELHLRKRTSSEFFLLFFGDKILEPDKR